MFVVMGGGVAGMGFGCMFGYRFSVGFEQRLGAVDIRL